MRRTDIWILSYTSMISIVIGRPRGLGKCREGVSVALHGNKMVRQGSLEQRLERCVSSPCEKQGSGWSTPSIVTMWARWEVREKRACGGNSRYEWKLNIRAILRAETDRCLIMKRNVWCTKKLWLYLEVSGEFLECFRQRN